MPDSRRTVTRSVDVAAPAERVWELVSDLPGMGRLSPENTGGRWRGGTTGPAVGAVFRGRNRRGWRQWSTRVEVVACEPVRRFAFDVSSAGLPVARWSYDVTPRGAGCTVAETWEDRRGRVMDVVGRLVTGVPDRAAFSAASIDATLEAVRRVAEAHPNG